MINTLLFSTVDLRPLQASALHVTNNGKMIILGAVNKIYPGKGKRIVIVINLGGRVKEIYENDESN